MAKKQLIRNKWFSFTVSGSKNEPRIKTFEKLFRIKESRNSFFLKIDSNQRIKKQSLRFSDSNQNFCFLIHWFESKRLFLDSLTRISFEEKAVSWFFDSEQLLESFDFWFIFRNRNNGTESIVSNQLFLCQTLGDSGV